jgi:hypothetical protein
MSTRGETCNQPTPEAFARLSGAGSQSKRRKRGKQTVEVTKALAALQPLYGHDNVEIVTTNGQRVRGIVRSMKTTQALTTPSLKMEVASGEIIKIPFTTITEIIDHNAPANGKG